MRDRSDHPSHHERMLYLRATSHSSTKELCHIRLLTSEQKYLELSVACSSFQIPCLYIVGLRTISVSGAFYLTFNGITFVIYSPTVVMYFQTPDATCVTPRCGVADVSTHTPCLSPSRRVAVAWPMPWRGVTSASCARPCQTQRSGNSACTAKAQTMMEKVKINNNQTTTIT